MTKIKEFQSQKQNIPFFLTHPLFIKKGFGVICFKLS